MESQPAPATSTLSRVRYCSRCRAIYRSDFLRCPTDGAPIEEHDEDPLVGTTLGEHYLIEAYAGEGAMGRVYRARHARLQRRAFAVKVLLGDLATTLAMRLRFSQEAEAASGLDHPNVVRVIDVGRSEGGLLYLVMDYVDGELLSARIARGPMPAAEVVRLARGMAEGLAHAHGRGLVHRDFKPDNVILADGVPRIVDFGLAITVEPSSESARLTGLGGAVGTPAYAAPEQASRGEADHRADLFALGVTMYEMLAGELPFSGNHAEIMFQNATATPPAIATRAPGVVVPAWLEAIVRRLMQHSPDARFASAADVIGALDRGPTAEPIETAVTAERQRSIDAPTTLEAALGEAAPIVRSAPPPRRRWPLVVGALAAIAIAGAFGVARLRGSDRASSTSTSTKLAATTEPPTLDEPVRTRPAIDEPPAPTTAIAEPPAPTAAIEPAPTALEPAPTSLEPAPTSARPRAPRTTPRDPRRGAGDVTPSPPSPGTSLARTASPPAMTTAPTTTAEPRTAPAPTTSPPPPPATTATPPGKPATVEPAPAPAVTRPAAPALITSARVAIDALDVSGSLTAGQVRRVAERLTGALAACYGPAATHAGTSPATTVAVRLVLDEDGRARDVSAEGGALPGLATCVAGVVRGARSTVLPDVGTVKVGFTIAYRPEAP